MEKLEILPQSIFKFKCPDKDLVLSMLFKLKNEKWNSIQDSVRPNSTVQTINNKLYKEEKYKELFEWFDLCLERVRKELNLNCDELKIGLSWGNKSGYNCWHHQHVHPNSFISGIFYLTNSNAKTWFTAKNIWNIRSDFGYTPLLITPSDLDLVIHKQDTISADLIIFPSALSHSVDEHMDENQERYTISFNCFPSGKILNPQSLHTIEINVI